MYIKIVSKLIVIMLCSSSISQELIPITETTIALDFEESKEIFFSFAEGDEVVFNLQMLKGKHIKEVEIIEMPSNVIYTEYKADQTVNKKIKIRNKGIYKFRFYSSSLTRRVCKINIARIPESNLTKSFNTNWKWKTVRDTIYTTYTEDSLIGYKKRKIKRKEKELIKIDTSFVEILSRKERVHSCTAIGKEPYSYINVYLPENLYSPNYNNPYQSKEVMSWSYWIGVGQRSIEAYEESNTKFLNGITTLGSLTGYGGLASLAVTGISMFNDTSIGDNVNYRFITHYNNQDHVFNSGNIVSSSGRNTALLQGGFTIELSNDNLTRGIDVNLKIVVVQIRKQWEDIEYFEEIEEPQYITLTKVRMDTQESKIRVPVD